VVAGGSLAQLGNPSVMKKAWLVKQKPDYTIQREADVISQISYKAFSYLIKITNLNP
jgi:hypothetical protein